MRDRTTYRSGWCRWWGAHHPDEWVVQTDGGWFTQPTGVGGVDGGWSTQPTGVGGVDGRWFTQPTGVGGSDGGWFTQPT